MSLLWEANRQPVKLGDVCQVFCERARVMSYTKPDYSNDGTVHVRLLNGKGDRIIAAAHLGAIWVGERETLPATK